MNPPNDSIPKAPGAETNGENRSWLTAEEFLAQVEAHREARSREQLQPRKLPEPRRITRFYQLNPHLSYLRKRRTAA